MNKYILIVSILLAFMFPSNTLAENESLLSLEELSIQVMPEYTYHPNDKQKDHVPLLIGYQGSMVNNTDHPQIGKIEIPLPMKEKDFRIGYVADYSNDLSKAYEIEYIIDPVKGTISWTTSEEIGPKERYKFVIEYYSESIKVKRDLKTLQYKFKSFADIDLVNVIFTTPDKVEKVKITPIPSEKDNHGDEKNTYSYLFQHVKAGEEKNFTLTYERSESKPTSELMNSQTKKIKDEKSNRLAIGAFSGISVLSVGALLFLIRKRK
ncbi:hypothetical protein [Neobacillus drentensis]|uniref:hypothetical protein n=1 Tax=Neobacillus drentensis TaxID=220684 RepID=UPI000824719A|nr:hypothetical protein [Neobacillus drentensis]